MFKGYINKKKVILFIGFGSTQNFILYKLAKVLNFFVYPTPQLQVVIVDVGTINFSRKWNNINLNIGEYALKGPINFVPMGGVDVALGVQSLQSLGIVAFNFQEFFIKKSSEGKGIKLSDITRNESKVISSNGLKKLLKKGHKTVISQLWSLDVQTSKPPISLDLQRFIDKHSKVFEDIQKGLHKLNIMIILLSLFKEVFVHTSNLNHILVAKRVKVSVSLNKC